MTESHGCDEASFTRDKLGFKNISCGIFRGTQILHSCERRILLLHENLLYYTIETNLYFHSVYLYIFVEWKKYKL